MSHSSLGRIAGILFVAVYVVGWLVIGDIPAGAESDAELTSFYDDGGNRLRIIIGTHLIVISVGFLLWFLGSLRETLGVAEGGSQQLTRIGYSAGVAAASIIAVGAAAVSTIAATIEFGDLEQPDPGAARLIPRVGYDILLLPGNFLPLVLVVATGVLTLRTGVFPRWFGWFSYVAAAALLVSAAVELPQFALLTWTLLAAALLPRRPAALR